MHPTSRKTLILFVIILLALSAVFESGMIINGGTRLLVTGLMWSVGIAALVALKLTGRGWSELGWDFGPVRFHAVALVVPIIYAGPVYSVAALSGFIEFANPDRIEEFGGAQRLTAFGSYNFILNLALMASAAWVLHLALALGEEIGWRGYLTKELSGRTGFLSATLITGALWAVWHFPILVFGGYDAETYSASELAAFAIMVISMSGAMAWLRLKSASLWPAVTMHASHNLFIQNILDPLTTPQEGGLTVVGEFGVLTAASALIVCAPFWIMGAKLSRRTIG